MDLVRATVLLILLTWIVLPGPAKARQEHQPPRFTTNTSVVVVDVSVRDSEGNPLNGLPEFAFKVFEDGKQQRIVSFAAPQRYVDSDSVESPIVPSNAAPATSNQQSVVAPVFEQLGVASLQLATRAAKDLIGRGSASSFIGLFTVDRALHIVTPYTSSRTEIEQGLDMVSRRVGVPRRRAGTVPGAEFETAQSGAPTRETRDDVPSIRGLATLDALGGVVESLRLLPGRKSVILFSEGLALDAPEDTPVLPRRGVDPMGDSWLTDNRYRKFVALLESANAARVAFYTFDSAGLRTESPFANLSFGRAPYVGLQFLAEQTGGAFVENTNDLGPGVRRAWGDQQHHYVLGYIPDKSPDESYRNIKVTVACNQCTVWARKGYRATTRRGLGQVGERDVAPLLVLEHGEARSELPSKMNVRVHRVPGGKPAVRVDAVVGFPRGADALPEVGVTPALLTVLARVRSEDQRTIAVLSQHFELVSLRGAEAQAVTFHRELELPPARYSVDLIAYRHDTTEATIYSKTVVVSMP